MLTAGAKDGALGGLRLLHGEAGSDLATLRKTPRLP
jgi:hypothetical protein